MILIADSGSTKTDWFLMSNRELISHKQSKGINPFYQDSQAIYQSIQDISKDIETPTDIFFYGAGCATAQKNQIVEKALAKMYPHANIEINSDLLAAARALCGKQKGIACILGTGSNSCLYDGTKITHNVSPLGYMLGDEGSGAVMGKKFISDLLKHQLPSSLSDKFYKQCNLQPHEIMDRVYKQPFPNRFLAQFTHFMAENNNVEAIKQIIENCFKEFFLRNIKQYPNSNDLPIHFVGSVAFHFREQLDHTARTLGYKLGKIEKSPMNGLIEYHLGI